MKIGIAINSFKQEKDLNNREKFCIESLRKCKLKNSNVTLYNVINENDDINFDDFETLKIGHDKKYPFVNHIIDAVSETDNELIVFLNNDIILNNSFFKQIEDNIDVYPASRAHLHSLDSLDEELKVQSYSVHGFDMFAFKNSWWKENKHNFPDMYLGKPYWDTVYFIKGVTYGNFKILNKQPPVIFHVEHQSTACKDEDEYEDHNKNIAALTSEMNKWWYYVQNVLLQRQTVGDILWWKPHPTEEQIEQQVFKNEN